MEKTCTDVAAAMYRTEAAVWLRSTNPNCTRNDNQRLANRKTINPMKIKDLDFNRKGFGHRGKRQRPLWSCE